MEDEKTNVEESEDEKPVFKLVPAQSEEEYLQRQAEFKAERTTEFILDTGLRMVLRIVTKPVWTYIAVKSGITAMSMTAEDIKAAKLEGDNALQLKIKDQMELHRVEFITNLIERTKVEVPEWFKPEVMDPAEADAFLDDYALEMMRVSKASGREEATLEKFRTYGLVEDAGSDEPGTTGDDPQPAGPGLSQSE